MWLLAKSKEKVCCSFLYVFDLSPLFLLVSEVPNKFRFSLLIRKHIELQNSFWAQVYVREKITFFLNIYILREHPLFIIFNKTLNSQHYKFIVINLPLTITHSGRNINLIHDQFCLKWVVSKFILKIKQ